MGDAIAIGLIFGAVFLLCLAACLFATYISRPRKLGPIDQDLDMRLMRTEAAYRLCEQHLAHANLTGKKRLAKIHELQAEVATLQNHLANLGLQASQETLNES